MYSTFNTAVVQMLCRRHHVVGVIELTGLLPTDASVAPMVVTVLACLIGAVGWGCESVVDCFCVGMPRVCCGAKMCPVA